MEGLLRASIGVIRRNADIEMLMATVESLENDPSTANAISDRDRLCLLDLPDPEEQKTNISAVTSLSKDELLERAAKSPDQLSSPEIDLLKRRYWSVITSEELQAQECAQRESKGGSWTHRRVVAERLRKVRSLLYEEYEETALLNADWEQSRRDYEDRQTQRRHETERQLANAPSWAKSLWELDSTGLLYGKTRWGFFGYVDPAVKGDRESWMCKMDAMLFHARTAVGCSDIIVQQWLLKYLEPTAMGSGAEEDEMSGTGDSEKDKDTPRDTENNDKQQSYQELEFKVEKLRRHFISHRDQARKTQGEDQNTQSTDHGENVVDNVFIFVDQASVDTLFTPPESVDDMWVWAVDPNFTLPSSNTENTYRGYFRVRLQQLVNNFFDVRRFHEDEYSMRALWEIAQREKNQAFVSVKETEKGLWKMNRTVGSALRRGEVKEDGELPRGLLRLLYKEDGTQL